MTALHRWTQRDGDEWACAVYDHGPHCRLCQPVVETLAAIFENVDAGNMEFDHVDGATGELSFRMTDQGQERAREAIRRMGGDPDDEASILPALKRDIAKSN